jgi:hypothetical protein
LQACFSTAHRERLQEELDPEVFAKVRWSGDRSAKGTAKWLTQPAFANLGRRGLMHAILAREPLIPIEQIYRFVFEQILDEKVTTTPVQVSR